MLSSEWKYVLGEEFCLKVTDGTHDSPKQAEHGKPLITSKHIKGDEIDFETAYLISEEDFNEINKRSQVDQWDVIISMIGAYCGFCFIESNEEIDYAVKNVGLFKTGSEVNAKWLYYYLNSPIGKAHLDAVKSGSTQPYIALGALRKLPILIPKKEGVKEKLLKAIDSIDSKIRVNNRINAELEAMAKTLYDYWFVQFDFPDANGKPYKTAGGKMVYNEVLKREIPEGWRDASLVDIAIFTNGIACQKYYPTGDELTYKVIKIREFSSGFDESSESVRQSVPKKVVVNDGDILFSWSATLEVKLWTGGTGALNQHIFKVTSDNYPKTFYYFEVLKYLEYFKKVAELRKTTMGHITKEHLVESRVSLPPKELIQAMDEKLSPVISKIVSNYQQNVELAKLRDWLLPMLMNGQVTLK
ncbi:restriction endonuclease subunit S [Agitococcus lubricus]|uniref:Type I restriction enzyme S subunit n=1 Tax=Agitococcus lubricus TaxID=1077255 RepID=A0A2T5IU11_9GAMM|nr:restriction endonuclease subunit S [Agitococcus lubricus]PTQ87362.1 type I restriction enzyme S subunit [Agitococcus lubricus]